jgi:hypothetical protein
MNKRLQANRIQTAVDYLESAQLQANLAGIRNSQFDELINTLEEELYHVSMEMMAEDDKILEML